MANKVYVVSETGKHNIAPALEYGEIEVVLPPSQSQVIFSSGPTVARVKRTLEDFSDDDYLLFIGDPTAIAIMATVAASKNHGRFKCLKWDKQERRYIPIQIDLFNRGESDDD
jgi:folate-dependent tRNA-U54 methylase TrmFO/GidA